MEILRTRRELSQWRAEVRGSLGLVMTMGALHQGHLDLVQAAAAHAESVLATVFVNPTQFAPGEDFDQYPRDLAGDAQKLSAAGVDALFAPTPEVMYPQGEVSVRFDPGPVAAILEGKTRPTHFAGVLLVVGKMFHLTDPDVAAFGKKDAQQLAIVTQMVKDLDFPVQILPVEIRREADGLAMSSRNQYLSDSQRQLACHLYESLSWTKAHAEELGTGNVVQAAQERMRQAGLEVDYVALVDSQSFTPVSPDFHGSAVLAAAVKVGQTRLIDNIDMKI